jgi:auxin-responsive protein IAA
LSPERDSSDHFLRSSIQFDEKPLFPLHPQKDDHLFESKPAILGNKRGFSDAMNVFSEVNYQFNQKGVSNCFK